MLITLYRPVNSKELDLIKESEMTGFPPRLAEQPIFYPVTNIEYARQITKDWNVPAYGSGYVLEFDVDGEYLNKFDIQNVGSENHNELWIDADELPMFNSKIIGKIRIVEEYLN